MASHWISKVYTGTSPCLKSCEAGVSSGNLAEKLQDQRGQGEGSESALCSTLWCLGGLQLGYGISAGDHLPWHVVSDPQVA